MFYLTDNAVTLIISLICASNFRTFTFAATQEEFAQETLRLHNQYRANHGVPPLTLDARITQEAQAWAEDLAKRNKFEHSKTKYGENLFWGSTSMSAKTMTDNWYSEGDGYDYKADPTNTGIFQKVGHFTQMVWKGSKSIGVGRAFTKSGGMIGVVNYYPVGNFIGKFQKNVLPLKKQREGNVLPLKKQREMNVLPFKKQRAENVLPLKKQREENVLPLENHREENVLLLKKLQHSKFFTSLTVVNKVSTKQRKTFSYNIRYIEN